MNLTHLFLEAHAMTPLKDHANSGDLSASSRLGASPGCSGKGCFQGACTLYTFDASPRIVLVTVFTANAAAPLHPTSSSRLPGFWGWVVAQRAWLVLRRGSRGVTLDGLCNGRVPGAAL